ncbi:MAG: CNNM domain-containing protein [Lactobacillaceae bacterium]|jgi:CBS domain containing-hemolysin-like protein|nr:CNNM domain-containing protein [Lactobacillaceae bacterium]
MLYLIVFAFSAISVSFLCSIWEAVLLSATPSYIASLEDKNPRLFKRITYYKQNIDTPLAAILTLNTVAHTVGAAGVGAEVADMYGSQYLGIASGIMTIAILILSEILPKTIGTSYWKNFLPFTVGSLRVIVFILRPFLYISEFMTKWLGKTETSDVSNELKALAKIGKDEKVIDDNKYRMIINIMNLHEVRVQDIMTPRTVVHYVKPGMTIKEFDKFAEKSPFSRFPVIDEEKDIYLGYIHRQNTYNADDSELIDSHVSEMYTAFNTLRLENLLSEMLEKHFHMAIVFDEYGAWDGIVTMEDIIETILGKEIMDESDTVADMQLYAKMKWKNSQKKIESNK